MRIPFRISIFLVIPLMLGGAVPSAILAGVPPTGSDASLPVASAPPASPARPHPDTDRKVWTNDDVMALGAPYRETGTPAADVDASAATSNQVPVIQGATPAVLQPLAVGAAPLSQEQDPRWYAQQMAALDEQLASIDSEEQRIRSFQATSTGLQTGLTLNAPCDGITTDNLLAQLDGRRQQVLQQVDDLSDTARRNDLAAGLLTEASAETLVPVSPDDQRAALAREYQERSDELARTRQVVQDMQTQAAAQNITLLPPSPGEGGNMTTDLLQRLDDRAQELQSQIIAVEGSALSAGVEPGALR
jgi:hypothetical protein